MSWESIHLLMNARSRVSAVLRLLSCCTAVSLSMARCGQDWFLEGGVLPPLLKLASDPDDTCRCACHSTHVHAPP